jgi:hypothetical protein
VNIEAIFTMMDKKIQGYKEVCLDPSNIIYLGKIINLDYQTFLVPKSASFVSKIKFLSAVEEICLAGPTL